MTSLPDDDAPCCVLCNTATSDPIRVCTACRDKGPRLRHPEQNRIRLLSAYYAQLNGNECFQKKLQWLNTYAGEYLRDPRIHQVLTFAWPGSLVGVYHYIDSLVRHVAEEWHLPIDRGVGDLRDSLALPTEPLTLRIGSYSWSAPVVRGLIKSFCPPEFWYDPTEGGTGWIREYAEKLRASLVAQAEALEIEANAAGYNELQTWYRSDEELQRLARRLYQRVILEWSWQKIGIQENVTRAAVASSVKRLAALLQIPLPPTQPKFRTKPSSDISV